VRFYGNTDNAMQAIGFKEIVFIRIDQLNDPFDPHIYFTTDFGVDYATLIDYVRQNHKEDFEIFSSRLPEQNWKGFLTKITDRFAAIRNSTFILSTCAVSEKQHPKDNLYMWSHYGNGHRGVAIEFNTDLLTKAVISKEKAINGERAQIGTVWSEISYAATLPKLSCEVIYETIMAAGKEFNTEAWRQSKFGEIMPLMIRTKSLVWIAENEWRLMWHNDETSLNIQRLTLLDDTIVGLYLGCRVSDSAKQNMTSQLKRSFPNAFIYDGKKSAGEFAVKFDLLK
jgi:hypothetical protein